jgi:TIR domain
MAYSYDVFVSYSHADIDWVRKFTQRLTDTGLQVARDEVFLGPGDVLVHAIEQAILNSAHGILVFSPESVASKWVKQEYATLMQRSIENGQLFIPVIIGDAELPAFAATRYYADFRHVSDEEYDRLISKIAESLNRTTSSKIPGIS